jgi:hypothetical protein
MSSSAVTPPSAARRSSSPGRTSDAFKKAHHHRGNKNAAQIQSIQRTVKSKNRAAEESRTFTRAFWIMIAIVVVLLVVCLGLSISSFVSGQDTPLTLSVDSIGTRQARIGTNAANLTRIETGVSTLEPGTSWPVNVNITFSTTFPTAPAVYTSLQGTAAATSGVSVSVIHVDTASATLRVWAPTTTSGGDTIDDVPPNVEGLMSVRWLAVSS